MNEFDAALQIDPENVRVRLSRASLNIVGGKYKADEDLDPILKASPNNFMASYLRALEDAKQQQYAQADRRLIASRRYSLSIRPAMICKGRPNSRSGVLARPKPF